MKRYRLLPCGAGATRPSNGGSSSAAGPNQSRAKPTVIAPRRPAVPCGFESWCGGEPCPPRLPTRSVRSLDGWEARPVRSRFTATGDAAGAGRPAAVILVIRERETMHRGRFIFAAALALVAASAQAAVTPTVSTDFTLQDMKRVPTNWALNGYAGLELNPLGNMPLVDLALTKNTTGNVAAAWTNDEYTLPSFTMWADVNIDFHPVGPGVDATCPADGFAMAFAMTTSSHVLGGGGGSIGLFSNPTDIPQFIGFEVNTWYGQDIDDTSTCTTGKNVTFAFENANSDSGTDRGTAGDEKMGGDKIAQVTAPDALQKGLINGGWYRYQWDVDTTTGKMDAYLTGLDDTNKAIQNMKLT